MRQGHGQQVPSPLGGDPRSPDDGRRRYRGCGERPGVGNGPAARARRAERQAAQIARDAGLELFGVGPCAAGSEPCSLLAVRQPNGEARVFRLTAQRCDAAAGRCLGGLTVADVLGGGPESRDTAASTARMQGAPGKDGAPPDPRGQAKAEANNEIIIAFAQGKYDNDIDQFWADLKSIHDWDMPSWREPDPPAPFRDAIVVTGAGREPAVLISGRFKGDNGGNDCGHWVSYTSTTTTIGDIRNWIGNGPFDGCDSEVAVFAKNAAAQLAKPEGRWTVGPDTLQYRVEPPIQVPTTVWVVYGAGGFEKEARRIENEAVFANDVLEESRCGIVIDVRAIVDRTAALPSVPERAGCPNIDGLFKTLIGFHPDRMNVYVVDKLIGERGGAACRGESDNVIVLGRARGKAGLAHEFGHWFDLWHTETMPLVDPRNIMHVGKDRGARDRLTAGQCYRANFSPKSYINMQGLRSGRTKNCKHLQDADGQCPGLKNEF